MKFTTFTLFLCMAVGSAGAAPVSEKEYLYGRTPAPLKNMCGKPAKKIIMPPSDERDDRAVYIILTQVTGCKEFGLLLTESDKKQIQRTAEARLSYLHSKNVKGKLACLEVKTLDFLIEGSTQKFSDVIERCKTKSDFIPGNVTRHFYYPPQR